MFYSNDFCCFLCNLKLGAVYIKCLQCDRIIRGQRADLANNNTVLSLDSNVCLRCFSNGIERGYHENTHDYKIIDLTKIETFDGWTLDKELAILDIIEDSKYDIQLSNLSSIDTNWTKISKALSISSPTEIKMDRFKSHVETWMNLVFNRRENRTNEICLSSIDKLIAEYYSVRNPNYKTGNRKLDLKDTTEGLSTKAAPIRPYEHTGPFRKMNGYRPARGDFETEYQDTFELKFIENIDFEKNVSKLCNLSEDISDSDLSSDEAGSNEKQNFQCVDEELESALKMSIIDSYNSLIRERYDWKEFVREFGLLNEVYNNQTILYNDKMSYLSVQQDCGNSALAKLSEKELLTRLTVPIKLQRFFYSYEEYVKYGELSNYQVHLVKRIEELQEFRRMGIKSLKHVSTYKSLKTKRLNRTASVFMSSLFTSLNRYTSMGLNGEQFKDWFKQLIISEKSLNEKKSVLTSSYQAVCKNNPLKIENYPDYDKLSDEEEKEFCRVARVQPAVFLRVKSILLLECSKAGFCSYSRARKIAGIDVNKTRLIHNLLVNNATIKASA